MNQIARWDWLPERARWSHLARSVLPAVSRKQNFAKSCTINPLLTKFVRSRWLDISLVLFCEFMDLDFVSVHKHTKKELGQYPAILTSHLVNNPYIYGMEIIFFKFHVVHFFILGKKARSICKQFLFLKSNDPPKVATPEHC